MAENLRLVLDILALLAVAYAIIRGVFIAGKDTANLKMQVDLHARWIADHSECSRRQIALLYELREIVSYVRGQLQTERDK
jgi:hypothetical protein